MDSLNLALYPQFGAGRYHGYALGAFEPLRKALGYEPAMHLIPDATNTTVVANGRFDQRVSLPAGSYIWAYAAYSQQPEGFGAQIVDLGTGAKLFSERIHHKNISGQGTVSGIKFPLHILPVPRLVLEPAVLTVQVLNLSPSNNTIQLVLFTVQPPAGGILLEKNEYNAILDAEAAAARRAIRGAAAAIAASPDGSSYAPQQVPSQVDTEIDMHDQVIEIAAVGKTVVIAGYGSGKVSIYELNLYVSDIVTLTLWDGITKKLMGTLTDVKPGSGLFLNYSGRPHFVLSAGNSLIIETSAAVPVAGYVRYRME